MPLSRSRRPKPVARLTHVDARGRARMVDVGDKERTEREAVARAVVYMKPATMKLLVSWRAPKGDVLAVARIAGIQAAKRTAELIPLCHAIALTGTEVSLEAAPGRRRLHIEARVRAHDRTGVEMEALTAAAVAALTVYDMLKSVDRAMSIERIELVQKRGGRTGLWRR